MGSTCRDEYSDLTEQIIGQCFKIHQVLGPGFPERIYSSSLKMALRKVGRQVEAEKEYRVYFEGADVGLLRIDLVVDGTVIVELKAVAGKPPKLFESQLIAYLKASGLPVGLLINFGNSSCQVRRLMNNHRNRKKSP
jgi:GxxExxY protein